MVVTVYRDTPNSAQVLMFWLTQDLLGTRLLGGGAFPPANDSTQVRLRAPQSTATGCWRPEKDTNVDVVQRKGNTALVSKLIKLVPERE